MITAHETAGDAEPCYYDAPCEYTSARLITRGNLEFAYGRVEARIKLPEGQGIWPAFWMLGDDLAEVGWPQSGEIDIMEHIGREPSTVHGTIHGPGYSGGNSVGRPYRLIANERFADDFHTFAIEWEPGELRWYVDGQHYSTLTPDDIPADTEWVYDHPFFLIMNIAVGGYWPGYPDESSTFPQSLTVDGWVRVTLPFNTFVRSRTQPGGAPRNGFGRAEVWGWSLHLPEAVDPPGRAFIDHVRLVNLNA